MAQIGTTKNYTKQHSTNFGKPQRNKSRPLRFFLGLGGATEMALIRRLIDPRFLSTTRSTTKATVTAPKIDDVVPLIRPKQKSEAGPEAGPKPIPPPKPHAAFMDDDP